MAGVDSVRFRKCAINDRLTVTVRVCEITDVDGGPMDCETTDTVTV